MVGPCHPEPHAVGATVSTAKPGQWDPGFLDDGYFVHPSARSLDPYVLSSVTVGKAPTHGGFSGKYTVMKSNVKTNAIAWPKAVAHLALQQ